MKSKPEPFTLGNSENTVPEEVPETLTNNAENEKYERCVICGEITTVLKDTHIDFRECYEIGCGQLCIFCYNEIHNKE